MEVKPGYKQTEVGVIPEDWEVAKIETIITDISMGPFGSDIKVSNFISSGVPVLSGANVASERLSESFVNFVSPSKANSLKKAVALQGDIVVTHRGTLGQISYIPNDSVFDRYVISQSQFRARFSDKLVIPAWIVLYFHSERGSKVLLEGKGHTGVPALAQPTKTFRGLNIPLPPLPEQHAIAEALADADALIESLEQLIAKKCQVKQGAMQELLTGMRRLPGFSGGWEVKNLGEVARLRKERVDPRRAGPMEFCVELEHITQGTGQLAGYTSTTETSSLKSVFFKEDVLFGKLRAYLRKHWFADCDGVCSTEIWVLVANRSQLIPVFLSQLVTVDRFIEAASSAYGTHMPRSDWSIIKNFEVQLPSIEEQTAIATILSDMDTEITALEAKLAKARQVKQGMMQELLTGRIRLI